MFKYYIGYISCYLLLEVRRNKKLKLKDNLIKLGQYIYRKETYNELYIKQEYGLKLEKYHVYIKQSLKCKRLLYK